LIGKQLRPGVDPPRGGDCGSEEEGGKGGVRVNDGKGGAKTMVEGRRVVGEEPFFSSDTLYIPITVVVAFGAVLAIAR